jgi:hypothetical protein
MFLVELARRVDEAHCGFTAIDDRHALKIALDPRPTIHRPRWQFHTDHAITP